MEVAMKTKQKSYKLMAWQSFEVDISSVVTVQKQTKVTRQNVGCELIIAGTISQESFMCKTHENELDFAQGLCSCTALSQLLFIPLAQKKIHHRLHLSARLVVLHTMKSSPSMR